MRSLVIESDFVLFRRLGFLLFGSSKFISPTSAPATPPPPWSLA